MRILSFLLLILAFSGTPAQQQQKASGSAVLTVVKFSWRRERLPGWEKPKSTAGETYDAMRERVDNERRIQQARNAGNNAEVGRREAAAKMLEDAVAQEARKAERPRDGYRYRVVLANTGSKTVSLVDWDYLFLDPNTGEVVGRHQFTSEENIKPGKTKEVSVLYLSPPVKAVRAGMLESKEAFPFTEQVVIARIQYSDGSTWKVP
jgi:hypothetical protein